MKNIFTVLMGLCLLVFTQQPLHADDERFIEVQGESILSIVPNEIHISITIERQEYNVKTVKEKVSKATQKVLDLAKEFQPNTDLIETQFVDIQPQYSYDKGQQNFIGYIAHSSLKIVFTDQEAYYRFATKLPAEAGNHSMRASFALGKIDEISLQVQQQAVENAKKKAEMIAKSAGASLGNVLQIRDVSVQKEGDRYPIMMMAKGAGAADQAQPDMAAGLKEIRGYATVRFELK